MASHLVTIRVVPESGPQIDLDFQSVHDPIVGDDSSATLELRYTGAIGALDSQRAQIFPVIGAGGVGSWPAFEVVNQSTSTGGSLVVGGAIEDLWRQAQLFRMAEDPDGLSVGSLATEVQRLAWVRAAALFSWAITPWIWLDEPDVDFGIARPVPKGVSLRIEPDMFTSRGRFFSSIGEQLAGPCGYAGQDFQGLLEILRVTAHRVPDLTVTFVEFERCEQVAKECLDALDAGFAKDVFDVVTDVVENPKQEP